MLSPFLPGGRLVCFEITHVTEVISLSNELDVMVYTPVRECSVYHH